jgi:hypothetical protein
MRWFWTLLLCLLLIGCVSAPSITTLTVTTESLPGATIGTIYAQQLTASGGVPPYTWNVAAGNLPNGVTLNASGVLAGRATESGSFTFMIQVTDSASSVSTIKIGGGQ